MTREQESVINAIEAYMLHRYVIGKRDDEKRYEIKYKQVDPITENTISLVIETGLIGDEGTLAAILCRDRIHVFVGKKGGVRCYVTARSGPRKGKIVEYVDGWLGCCHRSMEENR